MPPMPPTPTDQPQHAEFRSSTLDPINSSAPAAATSETTRLLLSSQQPSYSSTPKPTHKHHNLAGLSALRFRLVCLALWSATFLGALDSTVVATLVSSIASSFNAFNLASWLGTSYLLSLCCFTPIYGRLADIIGRRYAHLTAMTFFTIGTAMCGLAPNMYFLIVARGIAGIGGGGIMNVGSIIMSDLVDLRHRGEMQGYTNILYGLGAASGGVVGGWVSDRFGWRLTFIVQVPCLIASFVLIWALVPSVTRRETNHGLKPATATNWRQGLNRIDFLGSIFLVLAIGSLLLSVSIKTASTHPSGEDYRWSDPLIWGLLVASAVATLIFLLVEHRAREPILPLKLLARRTPVAVAISNFSMMTNIFSILYNVPLYFTAVKLQSSSVAGAHLLPNSILIGAGSLFVGFVMRRTGKFYPAMITSALIIVVTTTMMFFWTKDTPDWFTWVAVAPSGFGYAGVLTSTLVALMTHVTKDGPGEIAVATSMTYMFRTTGQVLGVAFSSAIIQAILETDLSREISDDKIIYQIRHSTSIIPNLNPHDREVAIDAYSHGLHLVAVSNLVLSLITSASLCLAENEPMPERSQPNQQEQEEGVQEGEA